MKLDHSNILIVDDDAETLALLHEILSKEGYAISTAPHAKAALEHIREHTPDLIMTDIHMPDMDGLAFLAELRAQQLDMPVILMTAYGAPWSINISRRKTRSCVSN
jgi:CheY-like chemotaxis protein